MLIRLLDIMLSLLGLLFLLPIFLILAVWIKFDSQGSIFFRQIRVGKDGRDFRIYKFRTMIVNAEKMGIITIGERDPRITNSGYFLRKYKLDELPQLINVLKGEMSFVGPRPEVRKYVEMYNQEQLKILTVKPGITDYASIEYINEDEILGKSLDPERTYIEEIMPQKIKYNMKYINNKTVIEYFKIIFLTIIKIIK
ncbi:MAG: sugar transferase [Flavobacteriaceae bacterium]